MREFKRIEIKKSQNRKVAIANKRQNQKSGSEPKKQRPPELKTSIANQDCLLPLELEKLLSN